MQGEKHFSGVVKRSLLVRQEKTITVKTKDCCGDGLIPIDNGREKLLLGTVKSVDMARRINLVGVMFLILRNAHENYELMFEVPSVLGIIENNVGFKRADSLRVLSAFKLSWKLMLPVIYKEQ